MHFCFLSHILKCFHSPGWARPQLGSWGYLRCSAWALESKARQPSAAAVQMCIGTKLRVKLRSSNSSCTLLWNVISQVAAQLLEPHTHSPTIILLKVMHKMNCLNSLWVAYAAVAPQDEGTAYNGYNVSGYNASFGCCVDAGIKSPVISTYSTVMCCINAGQQQ